IPSKPHHGEIAFEATALAEQTGVNGFAARHVHLVAAEALQDPKGIRSFQDELRETSLVEDRDLFARGAMFRRVVGKPVLSPEGIFHDGFFGEWAEGAGVAWGWFRVPDSGFRVGAREPVRAFPPVFGTETGAV